MTTSRYQRGSRSLAVNLAQSSVTGSVEATKTDLESVSQEEDYDIPEDVENIIGKYSCTLSYLFCLLNY